MNGDIPYSYPLPPPPTNNDNLALVQNTKAYYGSFKDKSWRLWSLNAVQDQQKTLGKLLDKADSHPLDLLTMIPGSDPENSFVMFGLLWPWLCHPQLIPRDLVGAEPVSAGPEVTCELSPALSSPATLKGQSPKLSPAVNSERTLELITYFLPITPWEIRYLSKRGEIWCQGSRVERYQRKCLQMSNMHNTLPTAPTLSLSL